LRISTDHCIVRSGQSKEIAVIIAALLAAPVLLALAADRWGADSRGLDARSFGR
jgi:hypothetical protein